MWHTGKNLRDLAKINYTEVGRASRNNYKGMWDGQFFVMNMSTLEDAI